MPNVTRGFSGLTLAACCAAALLAEPAWSGARRGAEQQPATEPERQGVRPTQGYESRGVRSPRPAPRGARPAPPPGYDVPDWNQGYWYYGGYRDHLGWWWIVGPRWYLVGSWPYWDTWPPRRVVVVERSEPAGVPPPAFWYRCDEPGGYYPYVRECPGGWTAVPATPPAAEKP